ncbi:tetratricopeptide repeat protein [Massilia sp. LXY-6]|uniref:tetratricopeptide repeat protein n=1 Tax=Massilia sp. LXY-6 TaxID=3379823 RepID=UPI003EE25985
MRYLVAILLVLLSACASAPPPTAAPPAELFADASFARPSRPVDAADLFTLSPEMRDYLHSAAFGNLTHSLGKQHGLLDALYTKGNLKLAYDSSYTRTAAETFRDRAGNCMSLVIMTAAFAKELNMEVRYQSVDMESWSRSGNFYLLSGHVNIVLGSRTTMNDVLPEQALVVDFLPVPQADTLGTHLLSEDQIVSMFQNNRAAEALVDGRLDDAYWWARAAVTRNPASAMPLNTLAVIYERHGDKPMAERVYRAALAREPENLVTLRNLEPVLAALGKTGEAQAIAKRLASLEPVPPFQYFHQGVSAYEKRDYAKARDLFRREIRRAPYNDEFHFWLAATYLQLGDLAGAREELALAVENSTQSEIRNRYSAKLAHLRQLGMR